MTSRVLPWMAAALTAAAVATLSESISPCIGTRTVRSAQARAAAVSPSPSAPTRTTARAGSTAS